MINKIKMNHIKTMICGHFIGIGKLEPIVEVTDENGDKTTYIEMTPDKVKAVLNKHIINNRICEEYKEQ